MKNLGNISLICPKCKKIFKYDSLNIFNPSNSDKTLTCENCGFETSEDILFEKNEKHINLEAEKMAEKYAEKELDKFMKKMNNILKLK